MGYRPKPDGRRTRELNQDMIWNANKAHDILANNALGEPNPVKAAKAIGQAMHLLRLVMNTGNEVETIHAESAERGPYTKDEQDD